MLGDKMSQTKDLMNYSIAFIEKPICVTNNDA